MSHHGRTFTTSPPPTTISPRRYEPEDRWADGYRQVPDVDLLAMIRRGTGGHGARAEARARNLL